MFTPQIQLALTLIVVCWLGSVLLPQSALAGAIPPFSDELEAIRKKHQVPALAAAAMRGDELIEIAALGVRRADSAERVTVDDLWHIGSCTKSMTATLAAILVERGLIDWHSTIEQVFPETLANIHPAWRSVTLEQLLTHCGGAPAHEPDDLRDEMKGEQANATEQRRAFAKMLMERPPEYLPGNEFRYSDDGYAIAGAMLERCTWRSWEELIRNELFIPLGMNSAGFGAPGKPDTTNQPWGHEGDKIPFHPIAPGPTADNPPAIGPAGTVHCSLSDLIHYAAWHARAGRGSAPDLLTRQSFEILHTPVRENYALGWSVLNEGWASGNALMHTGSNAFWYAIMWVAPEQNTAFVAVTNCYNSDAEQACEDAISLLVERVTGMRR